MFKTLAYCICYLIYPFSFLFPRKKNRYAFGSFRGAFNDNAKYLFIYANEHCDGKEIAWISKNPRTVKWVRNLGYKAYKSTSIRGTWHALTSKYWFFNSYTSDIMFCLSGRAICINLWHGVGLKRVEFNTVSGPLADRYINRHFKEVFFHPESFRRPDFLLTSAPFQTSMFAKAFRIPESRCLEYAYPRNSILSASKPEVLSFIRHYEPEATSKLLDEFAKFTKVYIYMPTWRDSQRDIFIQNIDVQKLNEVLLTKGELLLLKPHANTIINDDFSGYSNIRFIDSKSDVYPLLSFTDVLITDYSSILYDYILMPDKGVLLYLYDYAEYVRERDFYYPFDENVIGERVYGFSELLAAITVGVPALDEDARLALVHKFWNESHTEDSCSRLLRISEHN